MNTLVVTVREAAEALKCSRSRIFELLAEGRLTRGVKLGRQTVVTVASVESLARTQDPAAPRVRSRRRPRASVIEEGIAAIEVK